MKYTELKAKFQKEVDCLPMFFAFNDDQFKKGLKKINRKECEKIVSIGAGGYMKKSDLHLLTDLFTAQSKQLREFLSNENNLLAAILYELSNHEYIYSNDLEPIIKILHLDLTDTTIKNTLEKAMKIYFDSID